MEGLRCGAASGLLFCAVLLTTKAAEAGPAAELTYTRGLGAESCPDGAALEHAVSTRLGEDPFHEGTGQRFRAEVVVVGDRLIGHVASLDATGAPTGVREFEGSNGCEELVAAMALVISLAINPELALAEERVTLQEEEPEKPEKPEVRPSPQPSERDATDDLRVLPDEPRPPPQTLGLAAGLFGLAAAGTGPTPTVGVALAARGRLGHWSLGLEGRLDAASSVAIADGSAQAGLVAALLIPCWHADLASLCVVGMAGSLHAASQDLSAPGSDSALYAAAGARVGAESRISRTFSLAARLDLLATLTPLTIVRNGTTKEWRTPVASAAVGLGVLADIP